MRLSTLIDKLDTTVRTQSKILNKKKIEGNKYEIGKFLVEFMKERDLINIEIITSDEIVKKKSRHYSETNLFVVCNFELSLLPLKFNLPMVCKPLDWGLKYPRKQKKAVMLSDMSGGYLSGPTFEIYNRFQVISSHNLNNFNIELHDCKLKEMCSILNGLQTEGFQINKKMLEYIKSNRETFEKVGLLMPRKLVHINVKEAYDHLRELYFRNDDIKEACSLSYLLTELAKRVQEARYEDTIISLASAYEDYVFYLPAFMDFRGRIYRSGILHFHERDLARSLIVFAKNHQEGNNQLEKDIVATSAAFKYKKFPLYEKALQWYKEHLSLFPAFDESFLSFAKGASDPYQFIAKVLCSEYKGLPITQDAASSAYQIMSYLLMNEDMARKTNLIPHPDGEIQDVYMYMLNEFQEFVRKNFDEKSKMQIIESKLDRKLIKSLFMPLIYGKTVISMGNDIRMTYNELLSQKDCYKLAKLCNDFWCKKYPDIENFIKLISTISWFCSVMDTPVIYSIPFFTTIQDYMKFEKEVLTVYERFTKKRRRVTLQVPTTKRDKRKTQSSACANFIHQKDAYIAMKMIEELLSKGVPIYTVHANFITPPHYVRIVPDIYTRIFINLGHPLRIINDFLKKNLITPYYSSLKNKELFNNYVDIDPIQPDHLTELLNSIRPGSYSTKMWNKKVSDLVLYYNKYVEAVCGNLVHSSMNEERWKHFQTLMEIRSSNFSVQF